MHGTIATTRPIDRLIAALEAAVDRRLEDRPGAVAAALAPFLARDDLLEGCACAPRAERYARHLIHADPAGRFSLLGLVWSAGQASPVHAHHAWCAFGVHSGTLTENYFAPPQGEARPLHRQSFTRSPGQCCHGAADPDAIHQLANSGALPVVSLHIYGVGRELVECGVNRVFS